MVKKIKAKKPKQQKINFVKETEIPKGRPKKVKRQIIKETIRQKLIKKDKNGNFYLILKLNNQEIIFVFDEKVNKQKWDLLEKDKSYKFTVEERKFDEGKPKEWTLTKFKINKLVWWTMGQTMNNQTQSLEEKGENIFGSPSSEKENKEILTDRNFETTGQKSKELFEKTQETTNDYYLKDRTKRRLRLIKKKKAESHGSLNRFPLVWIKKNKKQKTQNRLMVRGKKELEPKKNYWNWRTDWGIAYLKKQIKSEEAEEQQSKYFPSWEVLAKNPKNKFRKTDNTQIIKEIISQKLDKIDKNGNDYILLKLNNREVIFVFDSKIKKERWDLLKEGKLCKFIVEEGKVEEKKPKKWILVNFEIKKNKTRWVQQQIKQLKEKIVEVPNSLLAEKELKKELIQIHFKYIKAKKQGLPFVKYEEEYYKIKRIIANKIGKEDMEKTQLIFNDCEKLISLELELKNKKLLREECKQQAHILQPTNLPYGTSGFSK